MSVKIRVGVKKRGTFGGGRWKGGGVRPNNNFRPKRYYFLLLFPFDAEAFKTCKNTIKLINVCALPRLGLGLWLFTLCTLTWPNWGWGGVGGWKFHFTIGSIIFPYQGILSKKKSYKKGLLWQQLGGGGRPLCGGHHPKVPLFCGKFFFCLEFSDTEK